MFLFNAFCAFVFSFFVLTGCHQPLPKDTNNDSGVVIEYEDVDGDGYTTETDCNDADATIHPGAFEVSSIDLDVDEDCDGLVDGADIVFYPLEEEYCGKQYYMGTALSWDEALAECRTHPEYDIVKDNKSSMEWLAYLVTHYYADAEWWTGLNDQETEGQFLWADGTSPAEGTFDLENPNSGEEDCVFYFKEAEIDGGVDNGYTNSELYIASCAEERRFLCQEKVPNSPCDEE